MMQLALENTAPFVICVVQEYMHQGVGISTIYHAFVSRIDVNMQSLLDNIQLNKRANGGGSLIWADMVATCRDQLSGVALVPIGTISWVSSTVIETGILGITEVPSVNKGGASSSAEVPVPTI